MGRIKPYARLAMMQNARQESDYGAESRFRDRRGREHYDNGRFAPMRSDGSMNYVGMGGDMEMGGAYSMEMRRGRSGARSEMDDGDDMEMRRARYPARPFGPSPVYRENGMRSRGGEMNQIGFNRNWEISNDYPMYAGHSSVNEMERHPGERHPGYARGEDMDRMPKEIAENWVRSMKGADGSKGQQWSMDQAKQIMGRYGYKGDPVEWYACLNMMKRDYSKAAAKLGVDKEDFYAAMTDAFLNDPDAEPGKLMRYYEAVAMK